MREQISKRAWAWSLVKMFATDRSKFQREVRNTRLQWRIWWKYDRRPFLEKWSYGLLVFTVMLSIEKYTEFKHFALPTEDPNELLKDPYWLEKRQQKLDRQAELTRRATESTLGKPS